MNRWSDKRIDTYDTYQHHIIPITSKLLKQCQPGSPQGKCLQSLGYHGCNRRNRQVCQSFRQVAALEARHVESGLLVGLSPDTSRYMIYSKEWDPIGMHIRTPYKHTLYFRII